MSAQHIQSSARSSANLGAGDDSAGTQASRPIRQVWSAAEFSPAIAMEIAKLFVRYWQDGIAHADITSARALDLIDFSPGNGYNGHQLIRALHSATQYMVGVKFRYLPVVPDETWMHHASAAPEMAMYRQQGLLVPLLGNPEAPGSLLADGRIYEAHNPVIILVHDGWARLPQRLLAVHYGKLLEADLEIIGDAKPASGGREEWRPADASLQSGPYATLFARYLEEFNSTPICYPEGALNAWQRWRRIARHGYLMLASGTGVASELRMRLHTFPDLVTAYRKDGCMPVHYGLLAHTARLCGAATAEQDLPDGKAIQIIMEAAEQGEQRLALIADGFDEFVFTRRVLMSDAMLSPDGPRKLENLRQFLRLSGHDPVLLAEICRELAHQFTRTLHFDRIAWRNTLDEIWANFLPELTDLRLHEQLANAAMHCGHWLLARNALLRGMRHHGESGGDLANLAWCEIRTGQMNAGLELVKRALERNPDNAVALQVMARIQDRLAQRDDAWKVELRDPQSLLTLEPLDLSHADAYFIQYRDPQIAIMTGLPQLKSIEETRQWIKAGPEERGRVSFAVLHRDHGFVAYVNLAVSEHAAFFCFWTGVDFQGQGYATAAARQMFSHAEAMGVHLLLTSAYKDNRRSIRALERLGFVRIPSQALPPDQDRVFFVRSSASSGEFDAHRELVDYYRRENLPLKFADDPSKEASVADEKRSQLDMNDNVSSDDASGALSGKSL